jgi:hypothetical protein
MDNSYRSDLDAAARWLHRILVHDPATSFAWMQPTSLSNKYARKKQNPQPLTWQVLRTALFGELHHPWVHERLRPIAMPLSIAARPEGTDGYARFAAIDVDFGGIDAVRSCLHTCASVGLRAFGQLSEGEKHVGGHVYIVASAPMQAALLADLARRVQAASGVVGEAYPNGHDLRLPLMLHLRAPGGPRRFPLVLQSGELIDTSDPFRAVAQLQQVAA